MIFVGFPEFSWRPNLSSFELGIHHTGHRRRLTGLFLYFFFRNLDCYPLADFLCYLRNFYLCDIGNNGVQRTTRKRLNGNDPGLHFPDLHKYQSKREIQICKWMIYTYLLDFWLGK